MITISIVSHNHGDMVNQLVGQLLKFPLISKIIITHNLPEYAGYESDSRVRYLSNVEPIGFGANHNKAFKHSTTTYFVILNPDVVIPCDPFPALLKSFQESDDVAIVAPLALNPEYIPDDNWRKFPTILSLSNKLINGYKGTYNISEYQSCFLIDWASGCFLLIKSTAFCAVNGFDETYFMYYEDVDICYRLGLSGYKIYACPQAKFIHDARRTSRRSIRYMNWHIRSLVKFQSFIIKKRIFDAVMRLFKSIW